jgi:hypothetical protein
MTRRVSPEGRLADYHPDVGHIWRSRHNEPEQEVFERLPKWMNPPYEDRDNTIDLKRLLPPILETLSIREQKLLWYRFWADYTLDETGEVFGLTRERIRQIEAKAVRKLKHPTRSNVLWYLIDYCPIKKRLDEEEAEANRQWYMKWREDKLIEKLLELRESP